MQRWLTSGSVTKRANLHCGLWEKKLPVLHRLFSYVTTKGELLISNLDLQMHLQFRETGQLAPKNNPIFRARFPALFRDNFSFLTPFTIGYIFRIYEYIYPGCYLYLFYQINGLFIGYKLAIVGS